MHIKFLDRPTLFLRGLPSVKCVFQTSSTHDSLTKKKTIVLREEFLFIDIRDLVNKIEAHADKSHGVILDARAVSKKHHIAFIIYSLSKHMWVSGKYKTGVKDRLQRMDKHIYILGPSTLTKFATKVLHTVHCADIARDLASEPSNIMGGPQGFIKRVKGLFQNKRQTVKITHYDTTALKQKGLNLILAMGAGYPPAAHQNENDAQLLIVDYTPVNHDPKQHPVICLAGKGVCFDAGGYSIKSLEGMYGMNTDKTGASIAVGLIHHMVTKSHQKGNRIIAIIPLIENRISQYSIVPGDIVTAYNKKTVEIIDPDAEGRLIIADALSYISAHYNPDLIVDIGTYTSWADRQHCGASYVYYTPNEAISAFLNSHEVSSYERGIRLPTWPEYAEYTKSETADFKNYSSNCVGDGNLAAMFLQNFIEPKYRNAWLHIDLANNAPKSNPTTSYCNSFQILAKLLSHITSSAETKSSKNIGGK